ncbi:RusA family crossover junction endodeoxyribonuclease [Brevundimonas sp.]|uniref:RusA family crossover junction endodeoxyribonuclease n=1 Tax=Brevundimonas sp. TaxID=1871086 RepID=UPI0035ADA884
MTALAVSPLIADADGEVRQQAGASRAVPACTYLVLPAPPSANKIWRSTPGSTKPRRSKEYLDWLNQAGWMVREQMARDGCDPVPGRVLILLGVERDSPLSDIDNRCKATLDLLVKQKVIDDDRYVTGIALSWTPRGRRNAAECRVGIVPVSPLSITFHPSPDGATGGWFIDAPDGEDE